MTYTIKDLAHLCEVGRAAVPQAEFVSDDAIAFSRKYDLVFASSSLQYTKDVYALPADVGLNVAV